MQALPVAYLLPIPICHDMIDDIVLQLVPDLQILSFAEIAAHVGPSQRYTMVFIRLYAADDDLPALLNVALCVAAGCPIVLVVPPEAEAQAAAALHAGVEDYLLATPLQLQRLPHMIERAATMARLTTTIDHAETELNLRAQAIAVVNDGIVIVDMRWSNQPVIYCNPAFTQITGYAVEEIVGQNCHILQGPETESSMRGVMRDAIQQAKPCHVVMRNYRRDGTPFWNEIFLAPVIDQNGHLTHMVGTQRDVTIRLEAEEHLRRQHLRQQGLSEVGKALADIRLNETMALQQAAQHVAQLVGDACTIMLISADRQRLEIAALYHADPNIEELSRVLFSRLQYAVDEPDTQPLLIHGQSFILTNEQIDLLPSIYQPSLLAYREHAGLHGLMLVPLWAQREVIGMMIAVRNQPNQPYTTADLSFFQEIAEWTALSVANLRLFHAVQHELAARQVAEESLRTAEAHYRMMVESLPLAISTIVLDQPGTVPYISPQIEELLGFRVAEWQAQPDLWRRQAHPDDLPGLQAAAVSAFAENHGSFRYEYRQYHRDGHIVWIRYDQRIITVDQQRFLISTMRDITQRKQAEAALQQTQELYRVITETISDAIITIDQHSVILYANEVVETIFGHSYRALVGQDLVVLIPDYLRTLHRNALQAYVETGQRHLHTWNRVQLPGLHRDGHQIPLEISFGDAWQDGRRIFTGIIHDITARKHSEALLQDSNERYDLAVQGSSDGIWDWNVQTDLVYFSPRFRELMGYGYAPFLGGMASLDAAIHPDDRDRTVAAITAHFTDRVPFSVEYRLNTVSDGYRWFLVRGQGLWDAEGRPVRMAGSLTDIHDAKIAHGQLEELNHTLEQRIANRTAQLESTLQDLRERSEELARANRELAQAGRLKDEFLANMSHELRTPLTSILGRAELLQEDQSELLTDFQRRSIRSIEESGRHLLELINDILDLSKIEAGKITLELQSVAVAELCQSCIRMVHSTAFKKRLTVHTSIDPALTTIIADQRRLKQIIVNLLSNAIKFTPADNKIGLEARADVLAQEAHFTVWDTGIGIAKEDQSRLFQPFVQIDSSLTRQYEGTGLGLMLVTHLTSMHGGRVTLDSIPDQGSRFTVTLPWPLASQLRLPG